MTGQTVGIDFGTSTTLVAVCEAGGEPRVLPLGRATPWLPSVAGLSDDGSLVVGEEALRLALRRQVRSIKASVTGGAATVTVDGIEIEAKTVMKAVLAEALRRAVQAQPSLLNSSRVFLGCPALWTGTERRLLADVAYELGLDVDVADIIDEPVAAGLHSVHSRWLQGTNLLSGRTVVFDAGGGTLDVAFLDVAHGQIDDFTVLSAEGIPISGDAVDSAVTAHLLDRLQTDRDLETAHMLLRLRATELKEALSAVTERTMALGSPFDLMVSLTRPKLEELFSPQMERSAKLVISAVRGSLLRTVQVPSPTEIRATRWDQLADPVLHVILVGGLSQMPIIATRLRSIFKNASVGVVERPQESVVLGLAMGDRLNRLNLPRPPVNFVVDFGFETGASGRALAEWEQANKYVYRAFSPLYQWHQLILGETHLRHTRALPYPPGQVGTLDCTIRCEGSDRAKTPLRFRVSGHDVGSGAGIRISHSKQVPATFSLFTNGDLLVTGSKGEQFKARVERWPNLRGPNHDYQREIELTDRSSGEYPSRLAMDDWRFQ